MLAIYPAALIVVTPAKPESENREKTVVRFDDVVERIHVEEVSLPYEAFRCHASTRTVTAACVNNSKRLCSCRLRFPKSKHGFLGSR